MPDRAQWCAAGTSFAAVRSCVKNLRTFCSKFFNPLGSEKTQYNIAQRNYRKYSVNVHTLRLKKGEKNSSQSIGSVGYRCVQTLPAKVLDAWMINYSCVSWV
jgi:hypothetical protein